MPLPLPAPELQFLDANGTPIAGGTVTTYIPGTDTLKDTWSDMAGTAVNTNPIVLDAAGRCLCQGSGEYRFVLRDALGNLIYDQLTTSFISDAMKPVVQADSISSALDLLGVTAAIQVETDRAIAAEGSMTTTQSGTNTTLQANIDAEKARAMAAETALHNAIGGQVFQGGLSVTDSTGHVRVTFPTAYSSTPVVMATIYGTIPQTLSVCNAADATGVDFYVALGGTGVSVGFTWLSWGSA